MKRRIAWALCLLWAVALFLIGVLDAAQELACLVGFIGGTVAFAVRDFSPRAPV